MSTEGNRTALPGTEGRRRGTQFFTGRVRSWARLEVMAFFVVPLMVLAAVATTTVIVSERIARTNALTNAESIARRFTQLLLAPLLDEALSGAPGKWDELNRIVSNRLSDGSITFLVVWAPDGQILYASVPEAVGDKYPPSEDLLAAVGGKVVSDVAEQPEASYQGRSTGPMVEVYVPVTSGGVPLVVEAYFSYDGIEEQAAVLRGEIIPLALGALVVLQLVQIPIATALARRVRRQETERAELLRRGLSASERDRRAIAGDVHDGPVQDLAGVSYGLSALRHKVPEENQANVDRMVGAVRRAVQSLRQLMVDLYPPDLTGPGLVASPRGPRRPAARRGSHRGRPRDGDAGAGSGERRHGLPHGQGGADQCLASRAGQERLAHPLPHRAVRGAGRDADDLRRRRRLPADGDQPAQRGTPRAPAGRGPRP